LDDKYLFLFRFRLPSLYQLHAANGAFASCQFLVSNPSVNQLESSANMGERLASCPAADPSVNPRPCRSGKEPARPSYTASRSRREPTARIFYRLGCAARLCHRKANCLPHDAWIAVDACWAVYSEPLSIVRPSRPPRRCVRAALCGKQRLEQTLAVRAQALCARVILRFPTVARLGRLAGSARCEAVVGRGAVRCGAPGSGMGTRSTAMDGGAPTRRRSTSTHNTSGSPVSCHQRRTVKPIPAAAWCASRVSVRRSGVAIRAMRMKLRV
jgi:hypothetical protein